MSTMTATPTSKIAPGTYGFPVTFRKQYGSYIGGE